MIDKLLPCSTRIRNLIHITTVIWETHRAPNTDKETYISHVSFLQEAQNELGTMQDRLYKQTETMVSMDVEIPESQWKDWIKAFSRP
jgi:hypothetical protein